MRHCSQIAAPKVIRDAAPNFPTIKAPPGEDTVVLFPRSQDGHVPARGLDSPSSIGHNLPRVANIPGLR
jgi:hypothetical protein